MEFFRSNVWTISGIGVRLQRSQKGRDGQTFGGYMRNGKLIVLVGVMAAGILSAEAQDSFEPGVQPAFANPGSPVSPNTMLMAPTMPPPPWKQPVPISPGRGLVYVPGNWAWNGGAWVWIPGAWMTPP